VKPNVRQNLHAGSIGVVSCGTLGPHVPPRLPTISS